MIKVQDLRVGNHVLKKGIDHWFAHEVTPCDVELCADSPKLFSQFNRGLLITPHILQLNGAKSDGCSFDFQLKKSTILSLVMSVTYWEVYLLVEYPKESTHRVRINTIKHLHELENIFLVLGKKHRTKI